MGHQVRGVIARTAGAQVELVTVLVPDPGPREVLVRVQACGVCHTDLHYREGSINDEFRSWSWPGGRRAGSAAPACGGGPGTASTAATPARR